MDEFSMFLVRQEFPRPRLDDVGAAVRAELAASGVRWRPGMRVAVAVGSRGIANLELLVREMVQWIRGGGGIPFIVPAMGSHGGATADGQRDVLAGYGITEERVGAPVHASMEVVELPRGDSPVPVYCDRLTLQADATCMINRVKPHTSFRGRYESGLVKMAAIGLGKQKQAAAIHALGVEGLRHVMPVVGRQVLACGNVVLGLAVVENAFDETMVVRALPAPVIPEVEPELLELARRHMPSLPLDRIDLLIVDEIGKNISGLGMDTHIIGRLKIRGVPEPERPDIRAILVRDLTPETHGNAAGIGLADIVTRQAYAKIDFAATYANVLTTGFLERARLPMVAENDREGIDMAFRMAGMPVRGKARIVRIRNTLHLERLAVSSAAMEALKETAGITSAGPLEPVFEGDVLAPW